MRKDIKGYEGKYQIDTEGNVYSVKRITKIRDGVTRNEFEKKMKPQKNKKGYLQVMLRKDGKTKKHFIHRLVAEHFIPNPDNKPQVHHKDNNKSNNYVDNLEWVTNTENRKYSDNPFHAIKPVKAFNDEDELVFKSINQCAKHFNTYDLKISRACKNGKMYFGYYFTYYKTL